MHLVDGRHDLVYRLLFSGHADLVLLHRERGDVDPDVAQPPDQGSLSLPTWTLDERVKLLVDRQNLVCLLGLKDKRKGFKGSSRESGRK